MLMRYLKQVYVQPVLQQMLKIMKEKKEILVYDCIFCIYDEDGNEQLYQAPKKDFSHISEYVEFKDLTHLNKEKSKCVIALEQIHLEWGENWDLVIDFFGQETADKIDDAIGYKE